MMTSRPPLWVAAFDAGDGIFDHPQPPPPPQSPSFTLVPHRKRVQLAATLWWWHTSYEE
ncbi:hypothetical protein Hdeb2414_s0012g00394141 [Helianthus debilis subsp. tardiflorus]